MALDLRSSTRGGGWLSAAIFAGIALATSSAAVHAEGFDWGTGAEAGSGRFAQAVARDAVVTIGEIPAGRLNPSMTLRAAADLDIQLYDGSTALVRWPDGRLNGPRAQTLTLGATRISWSGYDGDGTGLGNEWIRIDGLTDRPLTMKVYGYRAGSVDVSYRWDANPAAAPAASGSGSFRQAIALDRTVTVGDIPAGLTDVSIDLASDADIDVQLYDGATKIVRWPDGNVMGLGFRRFGGRLTPLGPLPPTALGPDHARELDQALLFD